MSPIAKRLKEARLRNGISQEQLGVLSGIDEMSASARMNQYERAVHAPSVAMVKRFASALNVPSEFFYAEDDVIATILLRLHRLTATQRTMVLKLIETKFPE